MEGILCSLVCAACLVGAPPFEEGVGSYLCPASYNLDEPLHGPCVPYCPQPGDIMLSTDDLLFWKYTFNLAFTSHPHHSGIVVARTDGSLGILEAGPHDTFHIRILDVVPNLHAYEEEGRVWIRQRRIPLTPEESAKLTEWAAAQEGKRFALIRLGAQLTPFRSRGPIRTNYIGGPHGERCSYFCSELLMESCVAAGLVDPTTARPAATYPRDVFFDGSTNPYLNKHLNLSQSWFPPARWTSTPQPAQAPAAGSDQPREVGGQRSEGGS